MNQKERGGIDWKNAESFASVGALKSLSILKQFKNKIDTIVIIINYGNQREAYSYDVSILKQTNKFKTICDSFIRYVNTSPDSLNKIKRFLGNKIIGEVSDSKLKKLFKSNFLNIPINECRFMGMKVVDDIVSLYFNVYYNNGKAQTYAFSFYLNQDDKIDGINIP